MSVLHRVIVGGVLVLAISGACLTGLLFYGKTLSDAEVAEGKLASPEETRARLAEEQRRFGAMTPAQHVAAARDALALGYDPQAHTGGDLRGATQAPTSPSGASGRRATSGASLPRGRTAS